MKYFLTFALVLLAVSCKKDDEKKPTPFSGTITVTAPAENTTITGGATFSVMGTITGNKEMHGYHITIYNENDESVVYENQYHEHASSYTVNEAVTHMLTTAAPLRLVVEAAGDHEGDKLKKEVLFNYAP